MDELRFDGRTAVITGAGGNPSLGRAYALLLASRGANIVVNDVGIVPEVPTYQGVADPEAVAQEIRELGGNAVSDRNDIASEAGAVALMASAIAAFGGVDILVNNAALCLLASFDGISAEHFRRVIDTNLMGAVWASRAAWPHLAASGSGRIVNIGASVFGGVAMMSAYGASKGGMFTLTQALAVEGAPLGIRVNTVNPTGFSRMVPALQNENSVLYQSLKQNFPPEITAPLVALLAHDSCPATGGCFDSAGGKVSRTFLAQSQGIDDPEHTIETLFARWSEVIDPVGARVIEKSEFDSKDWDVRPYD
jgi:NAD(P)-dependent dehydrogenase (short-subunit alcohol dehydrogenase family)